MLLTPGIWRHMPGVNFMREPFQLLQWGCGCAGAHRFRKHAFLGYASATFLRARALALDLLSFRGRFCCLSLVVTLPPNVI
jgi:hypothetical protein